MTNFVATPVLLLLFMTTVSSLENGGGDFFYDQGQCGIPSGFQSATIDVKPNWCAFKYEKSCVGNTFNSTAYTNSDCTGQSTVTTSTAKTPSGTCITTQSTTGPREQLGTVCNITGVQISGNLVIKITQEDVNPDWNWSVNSTNVIQLSLYRQGFCDFIGETTTTSGFQYRSQQWFCGQNGPFTRVFANNNCTGHYRNNHNIGAISTHTYTGESAGGLSTSFCGQNYPDFKPVSRTLPALSNVSPWTIHFDDTGSAPRTCLGNITGISRSPSGCGSNGKFGSKTVCTASNRTMNVFYSDLSCNNPVLSSLNENCTDAKKFSCSVDKGSLDLGNGILVQTKLFGGPGCVGNPVTETFGKSGAVMPNMKTTCGANASANATYLLVSSTISVPNKQCVTFQGPASTLSVLVDCQFPGQPTPTATATPTPTPTATATPTPTATATPTPTPTTSPATGTNSTATTSLAGRTVHITLWIHSAVCILILSAIMSF